MASVLPRLGVPLILLFAVAIFAALFFVPQPEPVALALAALGGFAVALARLRQWGLALAAALAPFPGVLWFGTSAYALIIAFSLLAAAAYGDAQLKGGDGPAALWKPFPALAGTLLLAVLWSLHAPVQLASLLAASAAAALCLPLLVLSIPLDDDAIMRGNRQRERLQRLFAFAARIAEPRWSLALAGAGLVVAVLGYFRIPLRPPVFDWLSVPAIGVLVLALTRDTRMAIAALAASALLLLFAGGVSGSQLLFALFVLVLGRAASQGDGETMARAIEDHGATIAFAGLAAMIAAMPRGGLEAALHAGFGLVAALILFPAFTGALYWLVPRRRSVEELYRSNVS